MGISHKRQGQSRSNIESIILLKDRTPNPLDYEPNISSSRKEKLKIKDSR